MGRFRGLFLKLNNGKITAKFGKIQNSWCCKIAHKQIKMAQDHAACNHNLRSALRPVPPRSASATSMPASGKRQADVEEQMPVAARKPERRRREASDKYEASNEVLA